MPKLSNTEFAQLLLEAVEELTAEIEEKKHKKDAEKDDVRRDYRTDPLYLPKKDKYLLFDEEQPEENVNILELGAVLEDGTPVCEGCLVAYMNEHHKLLTEADYHGRKVPLGKPMPNDPGEKKKSKVYVRDPKTGNVKKVTFGDRNMRIKKNNPKRRKSFRARHNCSNPGPRTKAKFWSCRAWE
jgi:hypothetical protein